MAGLVAAVEDLPFEFVTQLHVGGAVKLNNTLLGLLLLGVALPVVAADKVFIRNSTDRLLHFKMRCIDTNSNWRSFEAPPNEVREITAAACQKFAFEKSTRNPDGSETTVRYTLLANSWYRMYFDRNKNRWDLRKVAQTDF